SGSGTCTVAMSSDRAVTATFTTQPPPLQPPPPQPPPPITGFTTGLNSGLQTALTLTNVSQSDRRWRLGSHLARFAAAAKPPVGTTFRFTLNKAATVQFTFEELLPGRRVNKVNGKCMAQTPRNRRHNACTRSVPIGSLSFGAGAGVHSLLFQGRLTP